MFDFFDLHSDTATELYAHKKSLYSNDLNISVDKVANINNYIQTFAFWTQNDDDPTEARFEQFEKSYGYFISELEKNKDRMQIIRSAGDIVKCESESKIGALLAIEGGGVLEGKLDSIESLSDKGIRMITLTWNESNEISSGIFTEEDRGLTEFGVRAVKRLEESGIIVDVSHLSPKGFEMVNDIAEKPFIASHSNSKSICSHVRNLTDMQLKAIFTIGGLVGINIYTKFLENDEAAADIGSIVRHIDHMLQLGGEDYIAFGTDFDGVRNMLPKDVRNIGDVRKIYFAVSQEFGTKTAEKVFYKNARNFFINNLI